MLNIISVSYTHLDVYKRQMQKQAKSTQKWDQVWKASFLLFPLIIVHTVSCLLYTSPFPSSPAKAWRNAKNIWSAGKISQICIDYFPPA